MRKETDNEIVFSLNTWSLLSQEKGNNEAYKLCKVSYPNEAKGWVDEVYYERQEVLSEDEVEIYNKDFIKIDSLVWTETEETGFGIYQYEETTAIQLPLPCADYDITVTLTNPTGTPYTTCIKANDILKVEPTIVNEEIELNFETCIINGYLTLKILPEYKATKKEEAILSSIYIKEICVKKQPAKEKGEKPTIFLASDSTVQTYDKQTLPQAGWGEVLVKHFMDKEEEYIQKSAKNYETKDMIIENRAIGGRSSKSFIKEGRLDNLLKDVKQGDFVFVQFGHNDATKARPNRYVHSKDFRKYIQYYIDGVKQRNATCVLVTPVARRNCNEETGMFSISFNSYREVMQTISEEQNIPLLDLGKESTAYLNTIGVEESKKLFLWTEKGEYPDSNYANGVNDNTHLQYRGAYIFAGIVTDLIREYKKDDKLDVLKSILNK